jgi:DNA-binding MarR family transcriptional regulator
MQQSAPSKQAEYAEQAERTAPQAQRPVLRLEDFLPHLLNVCSTQVSQALSRIYSERYSIGVAEWRILVTLAQFGAMTAKAVGAHTCMHKTKVSRAVALLERRKLLTRRANREDLREAFLSLTPAGRGIYEEAAPMALDFAERLLASVEPRDRPALDRALRRLTEGAAALDVANPRRAG